MSFPVCISLFHTAQLVSASRQLDLNERSPSSPRCFMELGREKPREFGRFRGLSEAILRYLLPELNELHEG